MLPLRVSIYIQFNYLCAYMVYTFLFTELQLKPTHIPFKLVCYWEELLEKYTSASQIERQRGFHLLLF